MKGIDGDQRDQGGFTIKTHKTESGWTATVLGRHEITPVNANSERTAIEKMTTRLDEMSRSHQLND